MRGYRPSFALFALTILLLAGCPRAQPVAQRSCKPPIDPVPWLNALVRRTEREHPGDAFRFIAHDGDGWIERRTAGDGRPTNILVTLRPDRDWVGWMWVDEKPLDVRSTWMIHGTANVWTLQANGELEFIHGPPP